ncbi:cell division protein ZapA [Agarilytica rhodophyticola]|uniref:cell division protein ZapA n=1 Tax=Agarilytica rhodophyticola TaxID=1737490 RepID=UPI000B344A02|nr:cell division protein ZapA [Agarilytica rhodophyticola]
MSEVSTAYVHILEKEYQVACPHDERPALNRAAAELDKRMRAIKSSGTIVGLERIAVMTALNLCHELQKVQRNTPPDDTEALERIAKKLDEALGKE